MMLWNTLCPLVIPTDCQAGVQVVQVCSQPLSKPGLHEAIEQPKAISYSLRLSTERCIKYQLGSTTEAVRNTDTCCEQTNGLTTRNPFSSCIPVIKMKQTEIKLSYKYYCMTFLFSPLLGRKSYGTLVRNLPVAHSADKVI